jgi:thioredoxin 1
MWCGPCRIQTPIIEELEKQFGEDVEFRKVDADIEGDLAAKYSIFVIPTIVIEKDGVELKRYLGVTSKDELESVLIDAIK